jgi:hypothetical protein
MMKFLLFVFATLIAAPAFAADPPTLVLPTPLVSTVVQYLTQRPYSEVAQIIASIQQCVSAQVPDKSGAVVSNGDTCPAVTAALQPKPTK